MSKDVICFKWRFLIVEDNGDTVRQLEEMLPRCIEAPNEIEISVCSSFRDAMQRLKKERFDLLILDLKDESDVSIAADEKPAGLAIFDELKAIRFVPVIFYTALAHKVRSEQSTFVRVVEKTESITKVREEVKRVLETQLPWLTRYIEELQREYMWEIVSAHWREEKTAYENVDITYLLAKRIAYSLQKDARKMARKISRDTVAIANPNKIHPMEMYVHPPISGSRLAGDIMSGKVGGVSGYWIVLTPSCDLERESRLEGILLAQCVELNNEKEYLRWKEDQSTENSEGLENIIQDHRKKVQSERFKFLPGTFFLPDLVIDFQKLYMITLDELKGLNVIASMDSPYAESVTTKFSRYFGRIGTLDIDEDVVMDRLRNGLARDAKPEGYK